MRCLSYQLREWGITVQPCGLKIRLASFVFWAKERAPRHWRQTAFVVIAAVISAFLNWIAKGARIWIYSDRVLR